MWTPVSESGSIADRIERQVLALMSSEQLKPGDRLPSERELAALLGVSRPSLREAVKSLEARGRLVVKHGQGVFVATPQSQRELRAAVAQHEITLGELFAMREVLEVPAAGWAAETGDDKSLGAVASALDELNAAIRQDKPDFATLRRLDAAFHMRIVDAAGNRFLRQTLGVLQEMLAAGMETTLLVPGRLERSRTEHDRILAALRAGDAAGARNASRRHIRSAHTAALRRLDSARQAVSDDKGSGTSAKR